MYCDCAKNMGLFRRDKKKIIETKCKICDMEMHKPERLERHIKKAHANVPQSKPDERGSDGGLW
ncbi:MAG: Zinc finger protein [Cenarchaeum symbiont of Oopsacas minuta]|nr:Zinc finger protein [Cenarchaeum symbiont of Oopsacas minuta]